MTAVEWLLYHFDEIYHIKDKFLPTDWEFLEETSKAMEKEQMKNMYLKGIENYDPTFKRKSTWTTSKKDKAFMKS